MARIPTHGTGCKQLESLEFSIKKGVELFHRHRPRMWIDEYQNRLLPRCDAKVPFMIIHATRHEASCNLPSSATHKALNPELPALGTSPGPVAGALIGVPVVYQKVSVARSSC